jgi:lysophospholipase L1-like esterase
MKMPTFLIFPAVTLYTLVFFQFSLLADHNAKSSASLFKKGDRVAFVGGGLIERARLNGYLETFLTVAAGTQVSGLKFRNLGWSGDTVYNDARSYFGKPQEGRDRLGRIIAEWKPNVVFLNYGAEVALSEGEPWTDESAVKKLSAGKWEDSMKVFLEGYQKLVDALRKNAGDNLREIVVVVPPPLENLGEPLPNHKSTNIRLGKVRDALTGFAKKKEAKLLDLFAEMGGDKFEGKISADPLTNDGLHFTDSGYQKLAQHFCHGLGYYMDKFKDSDAHSQNLRKNIIEKNRLFFHRWRPANETYLFLFRKHEQGNNAKEIPQFDPIIEKQEALIEKLRNQLLRKEAIN